MLSEKDNELLTNTNRGTPMGDLFRRFWLPIALSNELPAPDCTPLRVKVLNEDLIAFRDTSGRVGLLDAYCPHRGAALFFGRNEDNGLRCLYHGWKFDASGTCIDLPNAPEGETYKAKINIKSYPCVDAGDMLWAYMGPPDKQPPFPGFDWIKVPSSHRYVKRFQIDCNYVQAMEGDFDPSHVSFLHTTLADSQIVNPNDPSNRLFDFSTSVFTKNYGRVEDTAAGAFMTMAFARPEGGFTALSAPWMMPIFTTAGLSGPNTFACNIRVPVNNTSIIFYRMRWSYAPIPEEHMAEYMHGEYYYPEMIPGTLRTVLNRDNDYGIDRFTQKHFTYSGIKTFPMQDIAMIENQWGPLADRRLEHLTSQDNLIISLRQRLLATAKALGDGIEPSEPWHPEAFGYHSETVNGATADEAIDLAITMSKQSYLKRELEQAPTIPA